MAARYFIPQSGDWAWDGAVWAATSTGAAGSAATPINSDDVYIPSGTASITSSLNQSGVNLNSLTIGFNGSIGTDSSSLDINLGASHRVYISGSGDLRLKLDGSSMRIDVYDGFTGTLRLGAGDVDELICGTSGQVIANGTTFGTVIQSAGCAITLLSGTTAPGAFNVYGGNHLCNSAPGTITVAGSNTTLRIVGGSVDISTLLLFPGATYYHDSSVTIGSLSIFSRARAIATGEYGSFTVSVSYQWAGSSLFENPPVAITYTADTEKFGFL